jgi:hypothetical protein
MTSVNLDQIGIVTAILNEIAKQVPEIGALPRQFNAVIDAANSIVREFARGEIASTPNSGIQAWRKTDQVGASSDFMAAKLGNAGIRDYEHPHDPSDFGRCLFLLEAAPELREKLPEMAKESEQWAELVAHWDELEALWKEESPTGEAPKLYARMKELLHPNGR